VLISINGKNLDPSVQPDALDQMLRGEVKPGNSVTIGINRPPTTVVQTYAIEFAVIDVPSVVSRPMMLVPGR